MHLCLTFCVAVSVLLPQNKTPGLSHTNFGVEKKLANFVKQIQYTKKMSSLKTTCTCILDKIGVLDAAKDPPL